jgi:hypothetical protein
MLDQHGTKVSSEYRTNFNQKYKDWARSLKDFVINEKLDLLELLLTKIYNVEKIIKEKYGKDEDVQRMWTLPHALAVAYLRKWIGWAKKSRSP